MRVYIVCKGKGVPKTLPNQHPTSDTVEGFSLIILASERNFEAYRVEPSKIFFFLINYVFFNLAANSSILNDLFIVLSFDYEFHVSSLLKRFPFPSPPPLHFHLTCILPTPLPQGIPPSGLFPLSCPTSTLSLTHKIRDSKLEST